MSHLPNTTTLIGSRQFRWKICLVLVITALTVTALVVVKNRSYDNSAINTSGTFALSGGKLIVKYDSDGIVNFQLVKNNTILIDSSLGYSISRFMKWGLYWEAKAKRLWVASSDVGPSVYATGSDGKYHNFEVVSSSSSYAKENPVFPLEQMPPEVRRALNL